MLYNWKKKDGFFFCVVRQTSDLLPEEDVGSSKRTFSAWHRLRSVFCFYFCVVFVLSKTIFQEPEPESSFGELGENCGLAGLYAGEAGE